MAYKNVDSIGVPTMACAMIDGIRRRLTKSTDSDPWDADQELNLDFSQEVEVEEASELPTDAAVLVAAQDSVELGATNDVDPSDFYKNLIGAAIQNGGKFGDHQISIPWLRMVLAGLDSRRIESESMWYGYEPGSSPTEPLPETPSYDDLFPSDRDVPYGPR